MSKNSVPMLPCPWCGSEDVDIQDGVYCIVCNECQAEGPSGDDDAEGAWLWNQGPYTDRHEVHAAALKAHAERLKAEAAKHLAKAEELLKKAEAVP